MESSPEDGARFRLRRAPRYRAFVLTGTVAGVMAALLAVTLAPDYGDGRGGKVLVYLLVALGALGALIGAAAALFLERRRKVRH
jgi:membrane associated rhomboid family serine protease